MLSVATWNINSVRFRRAIVRRFLEEARPDVLCLQETKVVDEAFPHDLFEELGYVHRAVNGQKNWHGVATVSRIPLAEETREDWQDNGEARHVGVRLTEGPFAGVRIENVYVPAGGDVPDRAVNPKFGQKLDYLERMTRWSDGVRDATLLVGDLNIAPLPEDVWNHRALLDTVSHTPVEVAALGRLRDAAGWVDLGRAHHPAPARLHSWWSYRARDWRASDRGRRLDHQWATPALAPYARRHQVWEACRGWDAPSDHVPLVTEFAA